MADQSRIPKGEEPEPAPPREADAYERKVLRDFLVDGRLKTIPAQEKKKQIILRYLVLRFEPGRQYTEREVNALIQEVHPDSASLRRYMVDARLLARDHGIYWRVDTARLATVE